MTVCGYSLYDAYEFIPCAAAAVAVVAFALRCRLSRRGVLLWTLFIALSCSRVALFKSIGGQVLYPVGVPEPVVRLFDLLYFGLLALAAMSVPLFFWRSRLKALLLPVAAYSLALVGILNSLATPVVREYRVESRRVPPALDGYRIVHISDIHAHCGCRRWHTQRIVDAANALDADLACITGDLADGPVRDCADYLAPLLGLKARDGVYAVSGNHEFDRDVRATREWLAHFASWGIPFLRNACVFPRAGLAVGGVDDESVYSGYRTYGVYGELPNVAKAFAAATNGEFRVLLQHRPDTFRRNVMRHNVDLQLSGHLHGGFMPILRKRVADKHGGRLRGLFRDGSGSLCLSAGCGPWGGFPLRFRTPLEIGLVVLKHVE